MLRSTKSFGWYLEQISQVLILDKAFKSHFVVLVEKVTDATRHWKDSLIFIFLLALTWVLQRDISTSLPEFRQINQNSEHIIKDLGHVEGGQDRCQ